VEGADQVVLDDREEPVGRDVLRGRWELSTRVVDVDVDARPPGEDVLDERRDRIGLADIARRGMDPVSTRDGAELGGGSGELLGTAATDREWLTARSAPSIARSSRCSPGRFASPCSRRLLTS
jgi:hypothetical protein